MGERWYPGKFLEKFKEKTEFRSSFQEGEILPLIFPFSEGIFKPTKYVVVYIADGLIPRATRVIDFDAFGKHWRMRITIEEMK
jgi:hypothetical protein